MVEKGGGRGTHICQTNTDFRQIDCEIRDWEQVNREIRDWEKTMEHEIDREIRDWEKTMEHEL